MSARMEACVFDAYGTLLDLTSAVAPHTAALGETAPRLLTLWRAKQLEYTWLRTLMGRYADFAQVTADALAYACEALGIDDETLRTRLLASFRGLRACDGAAELLARLRAADIRTAVLSNGTSDMLAPALASAGLAPLLDRVLSVEQAGCYKPDPRVYALAPDRLGVAPDAVLFVSGNAWDAAGAASAGLRTVWINREGVPAERLPTSPTFTVRALADVAALAGA